MKALKVLVNILLDIMIFILVIGILIALYGFIQTTVLKKNYSNYFGYTYFQILTGSMEDTINVDDIVFVRITKDVDVNDVVSFTDKDSVVTHRVIEKTKNGFITKGDNNNTPDGEITKDRIIGKVVKVGKQYGKVKKFVFEPIVVIPFIATVVLFSWYVSLSKKERSIEDEE